MNNCRKDNPITREDFRSLLLWKVFWKLLSRKTFLGVCLNAFFLIAGFISLSSFIPRFVGFANKEMITRAIIKVAS